MEATTVGATGRDMTAVVERLRASKLAGDSEAYSRGLEIGREWASERAEATELARLGRIKYEIEMGDCGTWEGHFSEDAHQILDARSVDEWLFEAISGDSGWDRSDFWESAIGEDWEIKVADKQLLRGFADGALVLWNEVQRQL